VRCLDLSASRNKLAVVDEAANVLVFNLITKELIFEVRPARAGAKGLLNLHFLFEQAAACWPEAAAAQTDLEEAGEEAVGLELWCSLGICCGRASTRP